MLGSPKVSVVVTCYNLGRYLNEAVDSVLAQTFQDFEIVVVDDGSTEPETKTLLSDYRRPKTRVVHIENRGLPGARNEGIRQTTGPYVCALDADDLLERTYFEKAVGVLDYDPSVTFVSHWLRSFGEEDGDWKPESADLPVLLDRNTINGAALVRRDALLAVGLFDETMRQGCEDWDLWISMVERGFRGVILPEVLFFYRRRSDSMSRIMMEGQTHVSLYRYLIQKHQESFETHLIELLLRRERDRITLLRESHDLELDCDRGLRPEIERLRDGLRVARRNLERGRRQKDLEVFSSSHSRMIADKEAELERRAQAIAERDTELLRQQQIAATRKDELERQARELAEREAELLREQQKAANQEAELERQAQVILERDSHLEHVQQTAGRLEAELARDRKGIEGLLYEIRALRSSWSWRLTRPLRAVYSWLFERE